MTQHDPNDRRSEGGDAGQTVRIQDTRQGKPGVRILWLLIVSAGAAAILLLGMWFVSNGGFARTDANNGGQALDSQAFQGDARTPPAADAPTDATGRAQPRPTGETPNVNAPTRPSN